MYKRQGIAFQLLGCLIGCVAIFLPSALLVLFFFPVWQYLKKYAVIYRSLEGINAAVVGIMAGATCYLITDTFWYQLWQGIPIAFADLGIVVATIVILQTQKIPAPWIVLGCLLLGGLV